MHLVAPQYSDGLDLYIYCYKIDGGGLNGQHLVEINNLNHYIGMEAIVQADFLEMRWMPFVFGVIILLILRSVVFGRWGTWSISSPSIATSASSRSARFGIGSINMGTISTRMRRCRSSPSRPCSSETNKSRISASPATRMLGAYLLTFSVLLIVVAGWVSRKETAREDEPKSQAI